MQVVTLFNLTHVLSHSLNTMSETIFSNSLIFQEFAKLKCTLNLTISKSQNLTNPKISRPKVSLRISRRDLIKDTLSPSQSVTFTDYKADRYGKT